MPDEKVETPDTRETGEQETTKEETEGKEVESEEEKTETSKTKAKPKDADDPRIHVLTRKLDKIEKKLSNLGREDDAEETGAVNKPDDDETDFKIFHADRIKQCADEFKEFRSKGYDLIDALELAELRKGITNKDDSEATRQASEGNDSNEVNRSSEEPIKVDDEFVEMAGSREKAIELKKKYGPLVKDTLSKSGKAE